MKSPSGIAVLAFVCWVGFGCSEGEQDPVDVSERTPVPQEAVERIFPEGKLTVIDTVRVDDPVFFPTRLEVLDSGEMIASDRGSHQAIRLSPDGQILVRYGTGVGVGPGEHRSVENAGQVSDGTVWTWDRLNRRVNVFAADGSFMASVSPERSISTATALSSEEFIGISLYSSDPFVSFDRDGRVSGRWGWFVDEPAPNALPFIGQSLRLEDGAGFVYVSMFAGRLYAYQADGSLIWHRSVVDRFETPSASWDGMDYDEDDSPPQQFSVNVSGTHIHTYVNAADFENFYLDTYDADSGDYQYSLRLSSELGCYPLHAVVEELYMRCKTDIVRFRIPE